MVYQDGKIYQQEYERGKILYDLKVVGDARERTGTTISFYARCQDRRNARAGHF